MTSSSRTRTAGADRVAAPCPTGADLAAAYDAVRHRTEALCAPLETEDFVVQSMPDVSPTRWHLGHTTWFYETFILLKAVAHYEPYHPVFNYLFNSYYNAVGAQYPRPRRGLLSRPTVKEVFAYRRHVDEHMRGFLADFQSDGAGDMVDVIRIGLNHEQQHQELILTDIKHVLSCNPLFPPYLPVEQHAAAGVAPASRPPGPGLEARAPRSSTSGDDAPGNGRRASVVPEVRWSAYPEGAYTIGHGGGDAFSYDHEQPVHRVFQRAFELTDRLVTCGEFLRFMDGGGYDRPEFWLSDGWAMVRERDWRAPLYWMRRDGRWCQYTLSGLVPVDPSEPACHVSYHEADAYARWAGARLPTEVEWEIAARDVEPAGHFAERGRFHPAPPDDRHGGASPRQLFGDVWEWTSSPYTAYPGYRAAEGAIGEYNGKFMCNQMVLRGGSCATPQSHVRATYRNFFPPDARWQFSGFRLAR